eukprot:TRINITY_DN77640_c0_g1_i1.p1 TRINITY_DN77640_c0_g1~~TRINITY_DN77640_c0_g1_i1.p1  ORF type:complete len:1431 (+),score=314.82 TRINITY_DN77640_c0_g1_i1:83-4375(+)
MAEADEVDLCPLRLLGRDPPLPREEGLREGELSFSHGQCQVCFEECDELPRICMGCLDDRRCCVACLASYFKTAVEDALYAMPAIRCPLCRGRLSTAVWTYFVKPEVRDKYLGNASALLSMRCPSCDETASFFTATGESSSTKSPESTSLSLLRARRRTEKLRADLQREELWCDLLSSREAWARKQCRNRSEALANSEEVATALVSDWRRFQAAEASADEFVSKFHRAWPPGPGGRPSHSLYRAARTRLPLCIQDPERRLALQLAWLRRYPKVRTVCCGARVCFKCKVRGWHRHQSCEERQRQETGREAQKCPNCQVPTTRSDGCNHIRCVCGTEWTWQERTDEGTVEETEDEDDSDRSSSLGGESQESLRTRTAIELAALHPGTKGSDGSAAAKVLKLLASVEPIRRSAIPPARERRHLRTHHGPLPSAVLDGTSSDELPRCPRGHALELTHTSSRVLRSWICDGCEDDSGRSLRFRCEDCDYDLCKDCFKSEAFSLTDEHETAEKKSQPGQGSSLKRENESEEQDVGPRLPTQRRRPRGRGFAIRGQSFPFRPKARARRQRSKQQSLGAEGEESEGRAGLAEEADEEEKWEEAETPAELQQGTAESAARLEEDFKAAGHAGDYETGGSSSSTSLGLGSSSWKPSSEALQVIASAAESEPLEAEQATTSTGQSPTGDAVSRREASRPTSMLPLHLAVRSKNPKSVAALLECGAVPSEVAFRELLKVSSVAVRQRLEDEIRPHLRRASPGSIPLWALISFGCNLPQEEAQSLGTAAGLLVFTALRRQRDPVLRQRYSGPLCEQLGGEWFEALRAEAATEELREELQEAEKQRRRPDAELVRELLAQGAEMQGYFNSRTADEDSYDGHESNEYRARQSETSSREALQEHGSTSIYWCPAPKQTLSCAELIAMRGDCDQEMLSWVFPVESGGSTSSRAAPSSLREWRKQRLLAISIWSGNAVMAKHLLADWGKGSLRSPIWRALICAKQCPELEDALREFIAARGLDAVEVPLWALLQLAKLSAAEEDQDDIACAMYREARGKLEAALLVEDGAVKDSSSLPAEVFIALRRCRDETARASFEELLMTSKLGSSALKRRCLRAATRELLGELRRALCERRSPNLALAAQLLHDGANPRAREVDDDGSDGEEPSWVPFHHPAHDGLPRTTLELLAMNRHARPEDIKLAIAKAVEWKADPSRGTSEYHLSRPLTLAVRARHAAAVTALLEAGAPIDRQALASLRHVSDAKLRHEMEDQFMERFRAGQNRGPMGLKDVPLWVTVQCGFVKGAAAEIKDSNADVAVLMGLRRCRDQACQQELRTLLIEQEGESLFEYLQAQAATLEMVLELREALADEREPNEVLIKELLSLGANPQARTPNLDDDDEDMTEDGSSWSDEYSSESEGSSGSDYSFSEGREPRPRQRVGTGRRRHRIV